MVLTVIFCSMKLTLNQPHEPPREKTNKMACSHSDDSDQPGHLPSLISVFAVHMKKAWVLSYPLSTRRRLWSDWADAQADLSLRWAHWAHSHFVGFVMLWLKLSSSSSCPLYQSFVTTAPTTPPHLQVWLSILGHNSRILILDIYTLSVKKVSGSWGILFGCRAIRNEKSVHTVILL